jgi:hypothetical protein
MKTTMKYHLTPVQWLFPEGLKVTMMDAGVENREPLHAVSGKMHWYSIVEISIEVPQKV